MRHFQLFLSIIALAFFICSCSKPEKDLKLLKKGDVVLAFGDSITYGTGATPETSYPSILETLIHFKVVNAGVPGEETRESIKRINKVLDETHPQLVIICLGGNDLLRKRALIEIKANLKNIIQMINNRGIQVVLIAVPRLSYNLEVPSFYAELGDEHDIPVANNFYAELISDAQYKSDYIHLNAKGYQQLAQKIANLLRERGAIE